MEIYKNDYKKEEDETLWELHEIRHELHHKIKETPVDKLNREALEKLKHWQKTFLSANR